MIKMLVIADDFTGALDTGVQFTRQGLYTKISTNINYDFNNIVDDLEVLVIDAQTRHLAIKEAYLTVKDISRRAISNNIKYIYKKTDSALRGNIGAELHGLLEGSEEEILCFIPALPSYNRMTIEGVHYIDGLPVSESVFGKDPFEPVKVSKVIDIISLQTDVECKEVKKSSFNGDEKGIVIFDANSDTDMEAIAQKIFINENIKLFAGCAGFASVIPKYLGIDKRKKIKKTLDSGLFVACGSVNPISTKQIEVGIENNFKYLSLNNSQKTKKNWAKENKEDYINLLEKCVESEYVIIDANNLRNKLIAPKEFAKNNNLPLEEIRKNISDFIGGVVKDFLDLGARKNIMIIGGDTLFAFMEKIGIDILEPVEEIYSGVVLSIFEYKSEKYNIISKSGGFGTDYLLPDLVELIKNRFE